MKFSNNLYLLNNYNINFNSCLNYYYNFIMANSMLLENIGILYTKYNNFIFFFIKKEKRYTKLKYSRVPQVDFVSGGIASMLAGLLGFLVTEKVGFELIDSGDFYILLSYLIIILNNVRILYKCFNI